MLSGDINPAAAPTQHQTDLQYHLQQKRYLTERLEQSKQQILLEKHMQKQQQVQSKDFLSDQLDQHIFYQRKSSGLEQFSASDNATLITGSFPDLSTDFLSQQLDQHIEQQKAQQERHLQTQDKRGQAVLNPLRSSLRKTLRAAQDNSDSSDICTSSATEDESPGKRAGPRSGDAEERGAAEGQEISGAPFLALQGSDVSTSLYDGGEKEEVPFVLQQHTLPSSLLKHRRAMSEACVNWDSSTGAVTDLMPSELTQYNTALNAQTSYAHSIRASNINSKPALFDSYAQVKSGNPSSASVVLANYSNPGNNFSSEMFSSYPPPAPPLPQVVVHSPRDSPIDYRTSYPLQMGSAQGSRVATVKNASILHQSIAQASVSSSNSVVFSSPSDRSESPSPHAFHPTSSGSINYYSLSSQTLPRNLPSRRVTFASLSSPLQPSSAFEEPLNSSEQEKPGESHALTFVSPAPTAASSGMEEVPLVASALK